MASLDAYLIMAVCVRKAMASLDAYLIMAVCVRKAMASLDACLNMAECTLQHYQTAGKEAQSRAEFEDDVAVTFTATMSASKSLLLGSSREMSGFSSSPSTAVQHAILARARTFLPAINDIQSANVEVRYPLTALCTSQVSRETVHALRLLFSCLCRSAAIVKDGYKCTEGQYARDV